ncbi:hypothetical protein YC2023_108242 [Brassica napus]
MGVRQHTQYVHVCPSAHTGRPWLFVCVCVSPSAHTGRLWLSISTHICTLVLGLSTVTLPVDCSGDFGPHGLSVQYTQDVRGLSTSTHRTFMVVRVYPCLCPSVHTGRPWLSNSTHISTLVLGLSTLALPVDCSGDFGQRGLSVQYTQNVRGCLPAHTGRPWLSVAVCQHTQDVRGCPCVSVSTHTTSMGVRHHTQDVCVGLLAHTGRLWLSMCVRQHTQNVFGCPSVHISARSTHRTSVGVRQHTLDVRGFPCVSVSTHRTSIAFRVCPSAHTGRPWVSVSTHRTSVCVRQPTHDVRGCPCVTVSTHRMSVAVHQYTYQHVGPCTQHAGPSCGLTSMAVCCCPSAHTGRLWPSVCVHQYTYQHAVQTGRLWVSVKTQEFRVCPSAHTGRSWLSVCVRVCPSAHTGRPWLSISTHISTLVLGLSTLALMVDYLGDFDPRGLSVQYTQDVRGCPPAHTGRLCLSVAVRQHTQDVSGCPCVSVSTHRTSVGAVSTHMTSVCVRQHTQDVHGCPCVSVCVRQHTQDVCGSPAVHISACCTHRTSVGVRQHTQDVRGCLWLSVSTHTPSVAVRVCPSAHIGRPCLSINTHICTLVLGLSTLALPVDCSGNFGPRGLSVQYTQDVRGCPSTHRMSVTHISTLVIGLSMLPLPVDCSGDFGPHGLSVQYTQDIRGCPPAHIGRPWLSMCVRVCMSVFTSTHRTSVAVHQYTYQHVGPWTQHVVHTARPWGSASTHRPSVPVCGCPSAHTGRLWLSVCVRGCPSAHTGRPCVSVKTQDVCRCPCVSVRTHMTSVAVHHTHSTSVGVRQHTQDVCGCMWLSVSTHRTSVSVHQYTYQHAVHTRRLWVSVNTQDVRVYPSAHTGRPWLSVCVRVCLSAHTGRPWLSISIHISTLVLGLSTLALPVDCLGDFGQRGLSVQYTQDVRGCPPPHTGRLCLFVAVRQHTQDVRGCPCVSVSTHRTSVGVRQHTQDVCVCPSAHTGRPWLSVCVRLCPSAHTGCPWLSISTHISTLVLGLSTLALPVDCLGDFSPCGLSVQYTQDVRGCPPAHTGRPWLSVAVRQHTQDVCGCLCVSVSTHRTSVSVHQYTYQHAGPWTRHTAFSRGLFGTSVAVRVCPSAHTGRPWLSISTHISTLVLGLSTLTLPMDCLGDFGQRGLSVQYTQNVRGLSASTHRTSVAVRVWPCLSVCVRQHTQDVRGCPSLHISARCTHSTSVGSASTHRTSVPVCGCPSAHTGRLWLSVCVRGCPSAHTGRPCVSVKTQDVCRCPCVSVRTHMMSVAVHHTHSTSVGVRQHTQDVCGCMWLSVSTHMTSVAVCVCRCVSVSTHRTSVSVHQYTYQHAVHTRRLWVSVNTKDVRVYPSAHTGRPWLSVCVRVCPSAHTGRPWLSISIHISTLVLGLSTLALPVDCLGDFGQRGLSFQYTQDVRGCPPPHTGRLCLFVAVRQHTQDVRGCPSVHISARWSLDSAHCLFPWTVRVILAHVGCLFSTHRTSVGVRQHTGLPCVSVSTHRTSVAVRVCPSAHTGRPWLSISTHISTLVLGLSTLTLPMDCLGDFGQRGLSVQYTQNVRGLSASTHRTSVAVRVWPCLSVCVRQHTQDVRGCPSLHISARWSLDSARWPFLWTVWVILAHVGCLFSTHSTSVGSASTHKTSVPVCGCPSAHTGRLWLSVCVRGCPSAHTGRPCVSVKTQDVCRCPCVSVRTHMMSVAVHHTHSTSVGVRQHTQDVCGCMWLSVSTHMTSVAVCVCRCVSVSTHRTSVSVHQYTYQHAVHTRRLWVSVNTKDVRVYPSAHTGRPWLSVCVRVCPSAHTGRPWLSISIHISTLVLGLSTLALPVDCLGDFGQRGLSFQYTQDVRGCPPPHTGRLCLFVAVRQHTQDVRGCPCVSVSTHRTSVGVRQHTQDVRVCPSEHTGRPWLSVCVRLCPSAHTGCPWLSISTHISTLVLGLSTLALPVDCLGDFSPCGLSVQYTQDVCGCPPAHTGHPWLSVAVRQHTQDVCGCLCVSVSTHRTSVSVHQYTYQHAVHTGRLWVSVNTQDFRVCPSAHTGRPCVSVKTQDVCRCPCVSVRTHMMSVAVHHTHSTSVGVRQHTQDVCGCMWLSVSTHMTSVAVCVCRCVSVSTHRTSVSVHQYTYQHAVHTRRLWVSVNTQDVRVYPSAHTGRPWLSVCVRVCPSAHTGRPWLSISIHISTLVLGLSTLALPVDCLGDFGQRGLSFQYTQDVRGCPPPHTGRLCLFVAVRQHTQDVRGCPCVSVSTHRTSVGVRQHTQDVRVCPSEHTGRPWLSVCVRLCPSAHTGCPWLSISTHISTLVLGLSTLALPVDCLGDFSPCGLSVQYTQDVCGCPPAHTGHPWLSVAVRQHTQDVCGCLCVSVSTHRTSVSVHQYTYQHAGPWTQHTAFSRGLFG